MENKENQEVQILDSEKEIVRKKEFDGIRELDNPPPPWIVWLFYITVFVAAFYFVHYHVFNQGHLQDEEYQIQMAKAEEAKQKAGLEPTSQTDLKVLTDQASLTEGQNLYTKNNCITCHGQNLEGLVGPNLTDDYWIHGNTVQNIVDMITNGNLAKGMTPFKDQISKDEMTKIAIYILSKQGSNPPKAKQPEGTKY